MNLLHKIEPVVAKRRGRVILAVFALALAVRVILTLAGPGNQPIPPKDDQKDYHSYAERIIEGDWLMSPVSYREVGYPFFLSFVYRLSDHRFVAARLANAVLGAATCVLIFLMAEAVFGAVVALCASLWFVFYFHSLFFNLMIQREIIVPFLLMGALLLMQQGVTRRRISGVVFGSLVWVALIHTDARFVFYFPFFLLYFFVAFGLNRTAIKYAAAFTAVFVVAMIPWQYRNYKVYGEFVLVNTRTLSVQAPWAPEKTPPQHKRDRPPRTKRELGPVQKKIYDFSEFYRVYRFSGEIRAGSYRWEEPWSLAHNATSILMYGTLIPFFLIGLCACFRHKWRASYLFYAPIIAHTLLHLIKWGRTRYRVPIEPLFIIIAFYGVTVLVDYVRERRAEPTA